MGISSVFLLWETHEKHPMAKYSVEKEDLPRLAYTQYATGDQWRRNYRNNEGMEPEQKQHPVSYMTGDESRSCKEKCFIVTRNFSSEVPQSCLFETPWTVTYHTPPSMGFSSQEYWSWVAISFSRASSQPRGQIRVSCIVGRCIWATREVFRSTN